MFVLIDADHTRDEATRHSVTCTWVVSWLSLRAASSR